MQYFCVSKFNFRGSCQINCLIIGQLQSMPESQRVSASSQEYTKVMKRIYSRDEAESFSFTPGIHFLHNISGKWDQEICFLDVGLKFNQTCLIFKVPFTSPSALHETNTVAILQPLNLVLSTTYVAIKFTLIKENIHL